MIPQITVTFFDDRELYAKLAAQPGVTKHDWDTEPSFAARGRVTFESPLAAMTGLRKVVDPGPDAAGALERIHALALDFGEEHAAEVIELLTKQALLPAPRRVTTVDLGPGASVCVVKGSLHA